MSVAEASAARHKLDNAAIDQNRHDRLIENGYVTEQEVDSKRTTTKTASADHAKALASIEEAKAEVMAIEASVNYYLIKHL